MVKKKKKQKKTEKKKKKTKDVCLIEKILRLFLLFVGLRGGIAKFF